MTQLNASEHVAPVDDQLLRDPLRAVRALEPSRYAARQAAEFLVPYVDAGCHVFNLIVNGRSRTHEIEAAAEVRERLSRRGR